MSGKKGIPKSPETKAKMAESAKAAWTPERRERARQLRGVLGVNYGRKWTPEMHEKRRQWLLEHPHPKKGLSPSLETRRKLSLAHQGKASLEKYGITLEQYRSEIAAGNKWCCAGKHFKPASEFSRNICRECLPGWTRHRQLKRHFGVTQEWYEAKLAEQGGFCGICANGVPNKNKKHLAVDHNHKTKAVRGLLCSRCNTALERADNVPKWLLRAAVYLQKYS